MGVAVGSGTGELAGVGVVVGGVSVFITVGLGVRVGEFGPQAANVRETSIVKRDNQRIQTPPLPADSKLDLYVIVAALRKNAIQQKVLHT
jgi:hypothetical protein